MMMQYDDETLITCCAMMTHCSNLWSASFESHCAEVSCSFGFIEIGCCLAKLRLFQVYQVRKFFVKVGCKKTLITQRRNKIFTNGFQLCNLEIMGYKDVKNRKLTKNAIRSLFAQAGSFCLELVQREHGRKKESRCQKGLYFCCLCSRLSSHQRPNCLFSQLQAYILSVVPTRCFPSRLLPFILASLSLSAFLFYLY